MGRRTEWALLAGAGMWLIVLGGIALFMIGQIPHA